MIWWSFPDSLAPYLVAVLRVGIRELRRDGVPVPAEVEELVSAANRRQSPPTLGDPATGDHAAGVDELTVDFRSAGAMLGVSHRSVSRLVAAGKLPVVLLCGARRIRTADLRSFVADLTPVDGKAA